MMNNNTIEEKPSVSKESSRKVNLDEYYETPEDEEYDDQEYRDQVSRHIAKLTAEEELVSDAIDAYHDDYFYQYVPRPHIVVWIKWYRMWQKNPKVTCVVAESQLAKLTAAYNDYQKKRSFAILLAKLRKEY